MLGGGLALVLSVAQFQLLRGCDPKLGCQGGVVAASAFAALGAFGISLCLVLFVQAASALGAYKPPGRHLFALALLAAVPVACWVTSAGWT